MIDAMRAVVWGYGFLFICACNFIHAVVCFPSKSMFCVCACVFTVHCRVLGSASRPEVALPCRCDFAAAHMQMRAVHRLGDNRTNNRTHAHRLLPVRWVKCLPPPSYQRRPCPNRTLEKDQTHRRKKEKKKKRNASKADPNNIFIL